MLIERHYKLELLPAKDDTRYSISGAFFSKPDKALFFTDGMTAAKVPVDDCDGDYDGVIIAPSLLRAHTGFIRCFAEYSECVTKDFATLKSQNLSGNFPQNVAEILRNADQCANREIGVNPQRLYALSRGLGVTLKRPCLSILFSEAKKDASPFVLKSEGAARDGDTAFGVIMPMSPPQPETPK